ncbi:MAG: hypothetical protein LW857_04590 [Verrucomicrobiae bacterium]|nr:hypothetical protein [Verrucomicrobiae bacterium]
MTSASAAPTRPARLRTLNAMLASLVGTEASLRRDVDAVVRVFESDEFSAQGLDARGLAAAAAHLLRLLAPEAALPAIAVLDHRMEPFEPLWAPERIEAALGQVGDASDVLLWVVGLQDQYLVGPKARSLKARQAYDEAVECVNAYAAHVQGRGRLTVVVL